MSQITLEVYETHPINPRRTSMFRATATTKDGVCRINMIADYVPSQDNILSNEKDCVLDMSQLLLEWRRAEKE